MRAGLTTLTPSRTVACAFLALVTLLSSGCLSDRVILRTGQETTLNLIETKLAVAPADYALRDVSFSDDGRRVYYSASKDGREYFFNGSSMLGPFDGMKGIYLDREGLRAALSVQKGSRQYLVVDGQEREGYLSVCNPTFSPDGSLVGIEASVMEEGRRRYYITTGTWDSPRCAMTLRPPLFSPDSRQVMYVLIDDEPQPRMTCYVSDARSGAILHSWGYERIGQVTPGPDGSWFAFIAEQNGMGLVQVVTFATPAATFKSPEYAGVDSLIVSPDGGHLAFRAVDDKGRRLVLCDRELRACQAGGEYGELGEPHFAADGRSLLYWAKSGNVVSWRRRALAAATGNAVAEKELPTVRKYASLGLPVVTPDGSGIAFIAERAGHGYVVVRSPDGQEQELAVADFARDLVFSPDGGTLVFVAGRDGRQFPVVADRMLQQVREGTPDDQVWAPRFSPDGRHLVYGARHGQELWWRVVPLD